MSNQDALYLDQVKQIYGGSPSLSAPGVHLERKSHDAVFWVDNDKVKAQITLVYKNPTEKDAIANIAVPFYAEGLPETVPGLEVRWRDQLLENAEPRSTRKAPQAGGPAMVVSIYTYNVNLPAKHTGSIKVNYQLPLARAGLGSAARVMTYRVGTSKRPFEQFQISIKWEEEDVFQILESSSQLDGFQIGKSGAFLTKPNATFEDIQMYRMVFYPGQSD